MATLTSDQRRRRERIETLIRLAAPGLNLLLAVGDRVSRIAERDDPEYYPPRTDIEPPPPHGSVPRNAGEGAGPPAPSDRRPARPRRPARVGGALRAAGGLR